MSLSIPYLHILPGKLTWAFNAPSLDFFQVVYSWVFFFICQICHILFTSSHDMSHDTIFVLRWKFCYLPFCNYTLYVLLHIYNFQLFFLILDCILFTVIYYLYTKWPILFFKRCFGLFMVGRQVWIFFVVLVSRQRQTWRIIILGKLGK